MVESFMKNPVAKLGALAAGAALALSVSAVSSTEAYAAELEGWLSTPSSTIVSTGDSNYVSLHAYVWDNAAWSEANQADDPTTQDASHFTVTTSNPGVAKVNVVNAASVRDAGYDKDSREGLLQISPIAPGKTTITLTYTFGNDTLKEEVEVEFVTGAWEKTDAGWKYKFSNGEYIQGTAEDGYATRATINGETYFFDAAGIMRTGWLSKEWYEDGEPSWYYLGNDGAAKQGWQKVGKTWYYFSYGDGRMYAASTKKMADGYTYGFTTSGAMAKGWFNNNLYWDATAKAYTSTRTDSDGDTYYAEPEWYNFNNNGTAKVGWNKIGGKWYYLGNWNRPQMVNGVFMDAQGDWYATSPSGAMVKGWTNQNWFWNSATGAYTSAEDVYDRVYNPATKEWERKWVVNYDEPEWYFAAGNGKLVTGWNKIKGKWYYFNSVTSYEACQLVTNGVFADQAGDWYVADTNGVMRTGWHDCNVRWDELTGKYTNIDPYGEELKSTWEYGTANGQLAYGWNKIKGKWYYMGAYGKTFMHTGWYEVDGDWYYSADNGVMAANTWVNDYYLTKSGAMAKNTWIGKYHVNADGVWDMTA